MSELKAAERINVKLHQIIGETFRDHGTELSLNQQCAVLLAAAANIIRIGGGDPVAHLAAMLVSVSGDKQSALDAIGRVRDSGENQVH